MLIPIMTGSIVFVADLIRCMPMKLSLELSRCRATRGRRWRARARTSRASCPGAGGKHVVLIDDILDSGRTLQLVRSIVNEQKPASVRTVRAARQARARRAVPIEPDYAGFEIPDEFVVGYGLDFDGYYRNLPDIATLKPEAAGLFADPAPPGDAGTGDGGSDGA
jgi:hypoxanthine phosphoribosyltransferase